MGQLRKTVSIGGEEYEIEASSGEVREGTLFVEGVVTADEDNYRINFDEEVMWNNVEEEVNKHFARKFLSNDETEEDVFDVDTSDRDYNEPRVLTHARADAQRRCLRIISKNAPVSSKTVRQMSEDDHSVSNYVSKLKDKGLVACVGYDSQNQILVPTHVGWKEFYAMEGTETLGDALSRGVDELF